MGIPKRLEARLAWLEYRREARKEAPNKSRRPTTLLELMRSPEYLRLHELYEGVWVDGGSFEDIPEEDRYPVLWEAVCEVLPHFLTSKTYGRSD